MDRLGKERGLISYATLSDYNESMRLAIGSGPAISPANVRDSRSNRLVDAVRHTNWRSIIRPRTVGYFIVWGLIGLAMLTVLSLRSPISLNVLHDRNPLFVELKDGSIRNGYDVKVLNMTPAPRTVTLRIEGLAGATLSLADNAAETMQTVRLDLEPDKVLPLRLYVRVPRDALPPQQQKFDIVVTTEDGKASSTTETTFESAERAK
jgi:polyferredoxin